MPVPIKVGGISDFKILLKLNRADPSRAGALQPPLVLYNPNEKENQRGNEH
jgi:hypothetical protein